MTFESFCERVKSEIVDFLPNDNLYDVSLVSTSKNNGITYNGLVISSKKYNLAPTIYLDDYYKKYLFGEYMPNILMNIAEKYMMHQPEKDFDVSMVMDYEKAKSHITRRLVNYERNKESLEERPYRRLEDLAVVYTIDVSGVIDDGMATIKLSNEIMKNYGITVDELDEIAKENTAKVYGAVVTDLMKYIEGHIVKDIASALELEEEQAHEMFVNVYETGVPMYFVTNESKTFGAVNILDESVQDELAQRISDRFCVIPSSVHEVIVIPFSGNYGEIEELEKMVHEVNLVELSSDEILSDRMYVVDAVNHVFLRMDRAEEYFKVLDEKKQFEEKREEVISESNDKTEKQLVDVSVLHDKHRLPLEKRTMKV